jgi:hypothetical protein
MMRFNRIIGASTVAAGMLGLAGCASVVNDVTQMVRVDTMTPAGEVIEGASCVAFNDRGTTALKSGGSQAIRRSAFDLNVVCTHPGHPPALGIATSRGNAGFAGNLIVGGLVGAVVDHNRGTGYTYPTWIRMEFGKALLFDRHFEKAGQPVVGYTAGNAPSNANGTSHACMQQVAGFRCKN